MSIIEDKIEKTSTESVKRKIVIVGIGGAGNNSVNRIINEGMQGLDFIGVDTDKEALALCMAPTHIQVGDSITKGLGTKGDLEVVMKFAQENTEDITSKLNGADMVFLTCGMGGGTGTGIAPVIADFSKKMGILTVGVVTMPFSFEGKRRMENAQKGLENLLACVDTLIVVYNDKILEIIDKNITMPDAFKKADDVLQQFVKVISEVVSEETIVNIDFDDIRAVMKDKGMAYFGIGVSTGDDKCIVAAKTAADSPLLKTKLKDATNIIIIISGEISLLDAHEAVEYVREQVSDGAEVVFGANSDDAAASDSCKVVIIATGNKS